MPETMTRAGHGAFADSRAARRYWMILALLVLLAPAICYGILAWGNPASPGSPGFWRIAQLRATSVAVILVVAWCQGLATVAFQTITNNRIITPSIMGFESLYRLVQTSIVFFFGVTGLTSMNSTGQYLMQVGLMVALAALLYGRLLQRENTNIHQTLLLGIVIGTGFGGLSTYMQNLLNPSAFDILSARLIGNISNADASQLTIALPLALAAGGLLLALSRTLDVLGLGRDAAVGLGVDHRRSSLMILMLAAVLMAVSTSLVGPLSFLGFLVAMTAYQLSDTHEHRFVLPMAWLVGVVILGGAYFTLRHIFYATGSVGIIIEAVGGTFFLIHLLRKGRL
ncbi:iron chelate uptake ABC transporter family permease subunit [[Pseudopropionibacterium] massiliense]|uniref:iron chelate uptake ABC transporter family permease subunit n=1 Tax=[Pseudopropionibacterium] massiliense TaxID=2220000 RepID=UPI001031AA68|nr:iron chelate uptake ABC transporter family permease subunit [[Pseudopropionibacterium] massiliense]